MQTNASGDWLDLTNFMLGVATLICVLVVAWAGVKEFAKRIIKLCQGLPNTPGA